MADLSTITVGGIAYNIKDIPARGFHYGGTGTTTKIKVKINSKTS